MKEIKKQNETTMGISDIQEKKFYVAYDTTFGYIFITGDCLTEDFKILWRPTYISTPIMNTFLENSNFHPTTFKACIEYTMQYYTVYEFESFNEFLLNHWEFSRVNIYELLEECLKDKKTVWIFGERKSIKELVRNDYGSSCSLTIVFNNDEETTITL